MESDLSLHIYHQVLLLHSDPRSVLFSRLQRHNDDEERSPTETANRLCSQMVRLIDIYILGGGGGGGGAVHLNPPETKVRDQQRLEEFGTGPNLRAVALFSEELFLTQVAGSRST